MLPQALLEVVNDLFEEQTDLEKIVRKIMQRALTLLQCERCSVLLLEDIDSPVRPLALYQLFQPHIFQLDPNRFFACNHKSLSCAKLSQPLLIHVVPASCDDTCVFYRL